ncbi:MAG: hypothetical protein K2L42_03620 [Clostridia bacterium]|nr:hypothetical protein [Clostridia bacterium]
MKNFKKLSALGVAAVMGCSVFAFTACNPDDGNGGDEGITGVSGEHAALINGALEQEIKALGADFSVTVNTADDYYNYENGKKTTVIEEKSEKYVLDTAVNVKANLESGDLDVSVFESGAEESAETSYMYAFMRSGKLFVSDELEEAITDYSKSELLYLGALKDFMEFPEDGEGTEEISGALDGILGSVNLEEEVGAAIEGVLAMESYTVMALADAFGALTVEGGKATVDLNKAVFNAVKALKEFVNGISFETTVGEIINNKTLKGVLTPFVNLVTPAELIKAIKDNLVAPEGSDQQTAAMYAMMKELADKVLLQPAAKETAYDYLVRVISSQELINVINDMIKEMTGTTQIAFNKTLDKLTLGFVLGMGGVTEAQFKAQLGEIKATIEALSQNITDTSVTIETTSEENNGPSIGGGGVSPAAAGSEVTFVSENKIENLKIVYTLDGNKITGQNVTAKVTNTEGRLLSASEWYESVAVVNVQGAVKYEASVSLANINGAKTVEEEEIYVSEAQNLILDNGLTLTIISNVGEDGDFLGITVKNGEEVLVFTNYGEFNECFIEDAENGGSFSLVYHDLGTDYRFHVDGDYIGTVSFSKTYLYYSNTVAGILAGTASTPMPNA